MAVKGILRILLLLFLVHPPSPGQEIGLLLRGGLSSYGSFHVGSLGAGGGNDVVWCTGPIVSAGARIRTGPSFAIDALIEYSMHRYDEKAHVGRPLVNEPENTILEFTVAGRVFIPLFHPTSLALFAGPSVSRHRTDDIELLSSGPSNRIVPGMDEMEFGGLIGLGIEVSVTTNVSLSIDGSLRARRYVTPAAQLGILYTL